MKRFRVIDSHTAGEPTRVIVGGGPDLGRGSMAERRDAMRDRFDGYRRAICNEPRGSEVMVGAILCEPVDPANAGGVIFFNNVGYLGMCGHGTIGLVETLRFLGTLVAGTHAIETAVGIVRATLRDDGRVSVENVEAYRSRANVTLEVEDVGTVIGDVAWGGNWFFLVTSIKTSRCDEVAGRYAIDARNVRDLTRITDSIMRALDEQSIRGDDDALIDHVELFGPPTVPGARSKNFVLCPGGAYDRSPCGTGTSSKLACLAADGKLAPGETWVQESILGTTFEASYRSGESGRIIPTITGRAHVNADVTVLLDPDDPFAFGI